MVWCGTAEAVPFRLSWLRMNDVVGISTLEKQIPFGNDKRELWLFLSSGKTQIPFGNDKRELWSFLSSEETQIPFGNDKRELWSSLTAGGTLRRRGRWGASGFRGVVPGRGDWRRAAGGGGCVGGWWSCEGQFVEAW